MTSEKINETAEKETISNCKRARAKPEGPLSRPSFPVEPDHPGPLRPSARHSARKRAEGSTNFGTGYNLKVASPLARIRSSVLFIFFSP